MALFGIQNTETLDSYRFKSMRRSVFYDYPNGSFPLAGLISLLEDEECSDPRFEWWEKRNKVSRTTMENISTTIVFGDATAPYAALGADFSATAGSSHSICIDDTTIFSVGNTIRVDALNTAGARVYLYGLVTAVVDSGTATSRRIVVKWTVTNAATIDYNGANADREILIIGTAAAEGDTAKTRGQLTLPINPYNYCQIFKKKFSITATQLQTPVKYDVEGIFRDMAKENLIRHMEELEWTFLFGQRAQTTNADNGLPEKMTGGILWYLEQYEAANSDYRGGTGAAAITSDTDDEKRIIENSSGIITESFWDDLIERLFRSTNNKTNEKLGICGNGFLNALNKYLKRNVTLNCEVTQEKGPYGVVFTRYVTPQGTLMFKTHPRWNQIPTLRSSVLFLDMPDLKYRYMAKRDTDLQEEIQPNDADYREDQYLTDAGLEVHYPERHMFIKNVTSFTA
jgi:hypothetical protein